MANKAAWIAAGVTAAFMVVILGGILAGTGASRLDSSAQATGQTGTGVTVERAAILALQAAPGAALQGMPDLVRYQGRLAYEAPMDRGTIYVDAQSGEILANTAKAAPVIAAGAVGQPPNSANQSPSGSPAFNGSFRQEPREGGSREYRTYREHDDDDD